MTTTKKNVDYLGRETPEARRQRLQASNRETHRNSIRWAEAKIARANKRIEKINAKGHGSRSPFDNTERSELKRIIADMERTIEHSQKKI